MSRKTVYRYVHEGIDVLAAQAPDLHQALERARQAGYCHVNLDRVVIPTDRVAQHHLLLRDLRSLRERAHALLIMRFTALRRVSLCPWRIGAITTAALVLLHHENHRTT